MRIATRNNRRDRSRLLVVRGGRQERLVGVQARGLLQSREPSLLPLVGEPRRRGGRTSLAYDVTGCVSVGAHARSPDFSADTLRSLCADLLGATQWCARNRFPSTGLLCGARHAYVADGRRLRLAFVPLDVAGFSVREAPLSLLAHLDVLAQRKLTDPSEELLVRELHALVVQSCGIFSVNRLSAFVRLVCEGALDLERGDLRPAGATYALVHAGSGRSFALIAGRMELVGRDPACDACLRAWRNVSRRHASLRCEDDAVLIRDEGSTNGTYVRGRRLDAHSEATLRLGERFGLASETFWVERR